MKIACIGNMNNNLFTLVRYLRDFGYDAHLFLDMEFEHFLPYNDSVDEIDTSYIHQLDWAKIGHWKITKEKMLKDLVGFTYFIGTDRAPAYLWKAGIKMNFFIPHGGDFLFLPFYKFKNLIPKRYEIGVKYQSIFQKRAIQNCHNIMYDLSNDDYERHLSKLKIKGVRHKTAIPMLYHKQYTESYFTNHPDSSEIRELRSRYDFIVFHHSRHAWVDPASMHNKNNHWLINGFAKFTKENPEVKSLLIMFEYGPDFNESKKLCIELGIQDNVLWKSVTSRKNIMAWASLADFGVGEFGWSWLSYGVAFEILTLKKPFIGRRDDSLYLSEYDELYPMVSVENEHDIKKAFEDYLQNKTRFIQMGVDAYQWLLKYAIDMPLNIITKDIDNHVLN